MVPLPRQSPPSQHLGSIRINSLPILSVVLGSRSCVSIPVANVPLRMPTKTRSTTALPLTSTFSAQNGCKSKDKRIMRRKQTHLLLHRGAAIQQQWCSLQQERRDDDHRCGKGHLQSTCASNHDVLVLKIQHFASR